MTLRFDLQQELAQIQMDRQQRDANIISQHLQRQKQLYRSLTPLVKYPQTQSITKYSNSLRKYQSQCSTQIPMQITNFVKGAFENVQQSVCDFIVKNGQQQKKMITEELSSIRKQIEQLKRNDNCDTEASRSFGLENYYQNNELKEQVANMKKEDCPKNKEIQNQHIVPSILQLKQNNEVKDKVSENNKFDQILRALYMMKNENQEQKKQKVKKQSKRQKNIDKSFQQTEEIRPKKIKRKQSDKKIESKENKDQKGKKESKKKIKQQSTMERSPSIDDRIKKSKVNKVEQLKRQENKVIKQSRKKLDSKQSIEAEHKKKKKDAKNDKQSDRQKSKSKIKDSQKKLQQVGHKAQKQKKKGNYQNIVDPADLLKLVNKKTSGPSKDKKERVSKVGESNKKINESAKNLNKQKKVKKETNRMDQSQVKEEKNKKKRSDSVASQQRQKDNKNSTSKNISDSKTKKKDKENKLGQSILKISNIGQSVKKIQKSDSKADLLKKGSKAKISSEEEKKTKNMK